MKKLLLLLLIPIGFLCLKALTKEAHVVAKASIEHGDLQDFMGWIKLYENGTFKIHYNGIISPTNCRGKYKIVSDTVECYGCETWVESFDTMRIEDKLYEVKALPKHR